MAETHCFIGTREVGKPKLRTTSSGASTASSVASTSRKSPQRISDILRLRRLRLNRAKTTASNSLSDRYDDDGVLYDYSNRQRIEKGNTYLRMRYFFPKTHQITRIPCLFGCRAIPKFKNVFAKKSQFDEIFENILQLLLVWIYDLPFNLKPIS